jgi:CHAT domain-containing protein
LAGLQGSGFIGILRTDDKQPMDASPLGNLIVEARTAIREGRDAEADIWLQQLHAILIAPLVARGLNPKSFDRLIIVPHRTLHSVPWAALHDGNGRRLVEDAAVVLAPSASIWHTLVTRAFPPLSSFLALANPEPLPTPNHPPLRQAEAEVKEIKKILAELQSVVLKNKDATESALRKQVAGKSIVHLATHGEFPAQDALDFHQLLLAAAGDDDGRVRAEELRAMDFHGASLVVLSICNGGIYRFGPGDEPYGLTPALLAAGACNVMGTLWGIEDEAGRELVVEFYTTLLRCGPAEALRQAACKFLSSGWDLRQWAAFVTVGSGRQFTK